MSDKTDSSILEREVMLVLESNVQKFEYKFDKPEEKKIYVIGRDSGCDIHVSMSSEISRRHAEISYNDGKFGIRDLGSKNGTYVNGTKVGNTARALADKDRIGLGLHTFLIFKQGMK